MANRGAVSGSARFTLLNVLGEFVWPAGRPVWTATLLRALTDAGFEHTAARQAIRRCAASGWLEGERFGRDVCWTLTLTAQAIVEEGIQRVEALGREPGIWDGRWLVLFASIPQPKRAVRATFYRSLRWAGFGNPTAGVWLTTHIERQGRIAQLVDRLELRDTTLSFVGPSSTIGISDAEIVRRSWNLADLAHEYTTLAREFSARRPRSDAAAFAALLDLDRSLQRLPYRDPLLPTALVPRWKGRRAAAQLLECRAAWIAPAQQHWRALVAQTGPLAPTGRAARG